MSAGADLRIRRMVPEDAASFHPLIFRGFRQILAMLGRPVPDEPTRGQVDRWLALLRRFPATDPEGCRVAEVDGDPAGLAVAIRRGGLWGLSLLFVDPDRQGAGIGHRLLDEVRATADGAEVEVIMSSPDPRAVRRYHHLGLDLHPAVGASGELDRAALPGGLPGRLGGVTDLDLVDAVDTALRGSSRADDVAALLEQGCHAYIADRAGRRGYVVGRAGSPVLLGAVDIATARGLLWRCLADAADDAEVEVPCLTAAQGWAIEVLLAARLHIHPTGPLFWRGPEAPPGPWLPSGVFF